MVVALLLLSGLAVCYPRLIWWALGLGALVALAVSFPVGAALVVVVSFWAGYKGHHWKMRQQPR